MKKQLLLIFSLFVFGLNAQVTLTLEPSPSYGEVDLNDDTVNRRDVKASAKITNTSDVTKTFVWNLTIISQVDQWAIAVCDINTCYSAGVITESFELAAGQTSILDAHVYPSGSIETFEGAQPGTGTVEIQVNEVGNLGNTITGEYNFTVTGDAIPSSLTELELAQLKLFPNPTSDYFEVKGPEGVERISIYNLLGTPVESFQYAEGSKFDVSNFTKGLYLVALEDEQGQLLKTLRLQKY